jgi:hypothetical protein
MYEVVSCLRWCHVGGGVMSEVVSCLLYYSYRAEWVERLNNAALGF